MPVKAQRQGAWYAHWGATLLPAKRNYYFTWLHSEFSGLCRCRKCDQIRLPCRNGRERDALRLRDAVLAPQMAIRFHRQSTAVFVSKPARNGGNIDA